MSNDVTIRNDLPLEIVALQHSTLDEAMALCERAHGIAIPSAKLDEHGCRSALAEASKLYEGINTLEKELEAARLERGREISAIKARLDEAVKAATGPLRDQRDRLGGRLLAAKRELDAVIETKRRAAEAERLRVEAEQRAAAEAARLAEEAAKRAAAEAAEAARKAADLAALTGTDPEPDDPAVLEAQRKREDAATAAAAADQARATSIERTFEQPRQTFVPSAPRVAVKGRTEYSLRIDDLALVPREVGGVPLWKLDEAAALRMAKELARHGKSIAGLTLIETETTSSKGRGVAFPV